MYFNYLEKLIKDNDKVTLYEDNIRAVIKEIQQKSKLYSNILKEIDE